jgi:manganese/zinc/iron transport system permease protein
VGPLIELWPLSYTDSVVATGALLLGIVAGVLGTFAVLRRRSLVGDALAHAALPGVCVAFLATGSKDPATLVVGAALAGVVGAFGMVGIERSTRIRADAAIGIVLSVFFSLGIVLLTAIAARDDADQAGRLASSRRTWTAWPSWRCSRSRSSPCSSARSRPRSSTRATPAPPACPSARSSSS